jgi:hypothetical protein
MKVAVGTVAFNVPELMFVRLDTIDVLKVFI